jgi:DNA-binding LacI/PurR family transcriptional regulator
MLRVAVERLIEHLDDKASANVAQLSFAPELIVRGSTAPAV